MHVALLCPYSMDAPGGVATHVLGLAAWLADQGHRASIIAPGTTPPVVREGIEVHLVGASRDFRFNGSVAQLALGRRARSNARRVASTADVVHVHEPLTPGIAFAVARSSRNLVTTHHASFAPGRVASRLLRLRAAAIHPLSSIAVSPEARRTAVSATGFDPEIIGNGVLLPPAPPSRTGWRGGARPRIGFLGRLDEPRKGFAIFREVAQRAPSMGLDAEFVALGPGRVSPGPVRLLGAVSDSHRTGALQSVDVLIAPNLFGESFGLILVEALAAGCDVLASDLPGFVDVLVQAGTGRTFPVGNVGAALGVLRDMLAEPSDPAVLHGSARPWSWELLGPRVHAHHVAAHRGAQHPGAQQGRQRHGLG